MKILKYAIVAVLLALGQSLVAAKDLDLGTIKKNIKKYSLNELQKKQHEVKKHKDNLLRGVMDADDTLIILSNEICTTLSEETTHHEQKAAARRAAHRDAQSDLEATKQQRFDVISVPLVTTVEEEA